MMKLIVLAFALIAAASACSDLSPYCKDYESYKSYYCKQVWTKTNCPKMCGLCTDGGNGGNTGKCGQQKIPMTRVVGGKDAKSGSWPWQIGMFYRGRFGCGGTLVNSKWVVTASHCVDRRSASSFEVVLGDYDHRRSEGEQRIPVKRIIMHPRYNMRRQLNNDIALMELSKPAMFNERVQPACLPDQDEAPAVGSKCFITGWGKIRHPGYSHNILQQLAMTVQSRSACNAVNSKYFPITEQMICGANPTATSNQSGCHGDSGGPFVCQQSDGSWKLHGAVSWGSPKCDARDSYTVFARVAKFRSWIDQYINN